MRLNNGQHPLQDRLGDEKSLLVDPIDKENWSVMSADVKGNAYERWMVAALVHPYAFGIRASCTAKASVLFFDKKPATETQCTRKL